MKIGFVTDSTADLPPESVARYGIEVVPALLIIDGREYRDQVDLPRDDFYRLLPTLRTPPTTAAPSIEDFAIRYEKLLTAGASHILSIHLAETLSSLCQVARLAAESFPGRVTVIDSGQLTLGIGFQVLAAAEAASGGLQAALSAIADVRRRVRVFALLDTLEYLRRSGRVSWARAQIGQILNLKPLVELQEGQVVRHGYARTTRQGETRLLTTLQSLGALQKLAVLHTNASERARRFLESAAINLDAPIVNVTTLIGTHVGPNGLGFVALLAR